MDVRLPSLSLPTLSLAALAQSVGSAAAAATSALPAAPSMASAISTGATISTRAAHDLALVRAPIDAAARGAQGVSILQRAAHGLGRILPWVAIGSGAFTGTQIFLLNGAEGLMHTKAGRSSMLSALGGALLLVPTPPTQLGAAALLAVSAANEFGAFARFDRKF
jgi:hypothetical protein